MSALSPSPQHSDHAGAPRRGRPVPWTRRIASAAAALCVAAALAVAIGFWWFVWSVPTQEVKLERKADGIVVLTGGSSRVADAIELLSEGRGRRLLITGVHRATTAAEIARLVPAYGRLINCCVDLDHSAINTVGNALETKRWAVNRGMQSLIIVTSNYHMPRAMAELERQLPEVTLIPFPVVPEKVRPERWWDPSTARLLLSEYLKYIATQVRMRFEPPSEAAAAAVGAAAREPRMVNR
jgi:uncharacterized SAM-binding protein YcdF (DUF218 family)